jgi:proteasome accessory factor C
MSRTPANARVARILAMVPWIAAQDGVSVDEICARFGVTASELAADLEVVFLVGVHPFSPAELIDVVVEDERVWVRYADYFARPLRLTPAQGLALVAAGSSLLSVPGAERDGPLGRGLAKVAGVLGVDAGETVDIDLGPVEGATFDVVREAIVDHRPVRIDYYAYGRDERSERVVEPHRLYAHEGHWYVAAHCRSAGGDRLFRLDRIHGAVPLDEHFEPPPDEPDVSPFDADPDDPRVVLELEPSARWVVEQYPTEMVEELDGGRCRVTLAVSARPWLERLLVRLGPDAQVVDADHRDVAPPAAARILARYR